MFTINQNITHIFAFLTKYWSAKHNGWLKIEYFRINKPKLKIAQLSILKSLVQHQIYLFFYWKVSWYHNLLYLIMHNFVYLHYYAALHAHKHTLGGELIKVFKDGTEHQHTNNRHADLAVTDPSHSLTSEAIEEQRSRITASIAQVSAVRRDTYGRD